MHFFTITCKLETLLYFGNTFCGIPTLHKHTVLGQQQQRNSEIMHKQRQKNWDYFEIDHPKAISDKKLQQLKSKYLRRRTESSLNSGATASIKEENEDASNSGKGH